nr:glycoside hydrolase family 3 C-terminal domain-containing protein [Pseudomonadota bacterium]
GVMTTAFVQGLQAKGVGATLKHYAANNQETDRNAINEIISERALREIYLPAFEMAVKEAKPWAIMSAYPQVNGAFVTQNADLLTEILRKEWGFDGLVMSDWFAVKDQVAALAAGNNLNMPGGVRPGSNAPAPAQIVLEAVQSGQLSEDILDQSVREILRVVLHTPAFNGNTPAGGPDLAAHAPVARAVAAEGMVLLKNDGNALPLQNVKTIAVIGENARHFIIGGGGSAEVNADPKRIVSLFDGLSKAGYALVEAQEGLGGDDAAKLAQESDVALMAIGRGSSEGFDRYSMAMHPAEIAMIRTVADAFHAAGKKVVVLLNIGAPIEMIDWNDAADAILLTWQPGQDAGVVADVLSGKVNPSGRLPETFPKRYEHVPSYGNFPGYNGTVIYGEGIYVGYRHYDSKGIEPMYPFGHGLSYTSFDYGNLQLSAPQLDLDKEESLSVSVDVTNSGPLAGKEVVQLYIRDNASRLDRPYQELKGFQKIALNPGETRTVTFTVDRRALSAYDPAISDWLAEAGRFTARVGGSSRDIKAEAEFRAVGNAAGAINLDTPWVTVQMYEEAATIVAKYIGDDAVHFWRPGPPQTFGQKLTESYGTMPELKDDPQKQQEVTGRILAEIADL